MALGGVVAELIAHLPLSHPVSGSNLGQGASRSGYLRGGRSHCGTVPVFYCIRLLNIIVLVFLLLLHGFQLMYLKSLK